MLTLNFGETLMNTQVLALQRDYQHTPWELAGEAVAEGETDLFLSR